MDDFAIWGKVVKLMSQEYVMVAHLLIAVLGAADSLFAALYALTNLRSMVAGTRKPFRW